MSKSIKRTLSLLLALTMVLSLGLPAYAVGAPEDDIAISEEPAVKTANLPIGAGKQPGVIEEDEIISDDLIVDIVDAETVVEEEAAPAKDFSYSESATGFSVEVSAPAGALPLGTEMVVDRLVDLSAVQSAVDSAENLEGEVQLAADISFWLNGQEIEPAAGSKLLVRMSAPEIAGIADPVVIHLPDGENAVPEIVEQMSADDDLVLVNAVEFEAEDFSVYAVIGEVIIEDEEGTIDFESEDYIVTVSYTKEAQIPAGTKLTVSEIPFLSEEYAELLAAAQEKLNENAVFGGAEDDPDTRRGIAAAIFVDVSLEFNGKPFEPAVPLDVKITLKNAALFCPAGEDALVVHFGDKGTELIEDVAVGLAVREVPSGMPEGLMLNSFEYEQNGFSAVGLISTDKFIDFEKAVPVNAYQPIHPVKDTPQIAAGKTVTDTDNDGISELALTVTGKADTSTTTTVDKANVILVIDVSGSMSNNGSWIYSEYTYDEETYNAETNYYSTPSFGYWENQRVRVYYSEEYETWYYVSGNTAYSYDGTVYIYETRLDATKRAACNLVDVLLANNDPNDNKLKDIMEISVIKFAELNEDDPTDGYNGTETLVSKSTDGSTIKDTINGLKGAGGTNWSAALRQAKNEADTKYKPEEGQKTSIIFLTDGLPTRYLNSNGTDWLGDGGEGNSNVRDSYNNARTYARNLIRYNNADTGYTLYSIFAYGGSSGSRCLNNLTIHAYKNTSPSWNTNNDSSPDEHYFNAQNTEDLEEAFESIAHAIQNAVGFAGVSVTDGVSLGATNTSLAVNGTVDASSFRYSVSKNAALYDVHIENGTATFTIYGDGEPTVLTDTSAEEVTTTINGKEIKTLVYSVTVGTGADAKTYKMSPATIDENGLVKWDLSGLGILEDGVTYKLAFDVWPNQVAYDIAADLNNKIYNSVDDALDAYVAKGLVDEADIDRIKNALENRSGTYYVHTNYEQKVEFYPAESHTDEDGNVTWEYGEPVTQDLIEPPAIELKGSSLPLTKIWKSDLSEGEINELLWKDGVVNGTSTEYGITLHVWKADTEAALIEQYSNPEDNDPYQSYTLGWDKDQNTYVWTKAMAIAPGMMLRVDKAEKLGFDVSDTSKLVNYKHKDETGTEVTDTYYVVENGHYYYVTEDNSDLHFELSTHIYHPMIVDGKLVDLTLDESGKLVEQMVDMSAVTATNTLKGGLNISKVVTGEDKTTEVKDPETGLKTCEDEFTFKITIWKEDEEGNKTPVYTTDDQIDTSEATPKTISGSVGYRIFAKPTGFDDDGNVVYDKNAQKRGAVLAEDSEYADLANGVFAEITDTETTITLTMPANGEIRLVNLPAGTHYTVEEILDSENTSYQHFKTVHAVKTGSGTTEDDPVTDIRVSGEVHGNMAAVETFYNWAASFYVYHSADNTIEKISFADNRVKGEYDEENGYTYTFNIAKETKDGFIYGGYYRDFADKGTFDVTKDTFTKATEAVATTYDGEHKDGYWLDVEDGEPYLGDASKWDRAQAYTENGTAMEPKANAVYFLREVPDVYMRGALRYTYYNNADKNIGTVWLATAIDDEAGDGKSYKDFGLLIGFDFEKLTSESSAAGSTAASLRIETRTDSNVFKTYTAGDMLKPINADFANAKGFVGYIMIRDVSIYGNGSMPESLVENNQKTAMYWVTPDDVQVTGVRVSSVDHIGGTANTIKLSKFGKYEAAEKDITSTLIYVGE